MKKLTSIEQLKPNKHFVVIDGNDIRSYEFICIHPKCDKYILALESCSQEGKKLYVDNLLGKTVIYPEVYVGEWDDVFICEKMIDYHKRKIDVLSKRLEGLKEREAKK